jgi:hypothetical protein
MSPTTEPDGRFAARFVEATGRDAVTEPQRDDRSHRVHDDRSHRVHDDRDVATDVADAAPDSGLGDAIDEPETN